MRTPLWRRYLRFWRADSAADINDEFAFHLAECVDDLVARGIELRAAQEEALRLFGDIGQVKRTCRQVAEQREAQMTRSEMLGVIKRDVTVAIRVLRRAPAVTGAILLTLALGIGATTAIYSVLSAVLLRPLPYANPDRMVAVWETWAGRRGSASGGHIADWTAQSKDVFQAISAFQGRTFVLTDGDPTRVFGARVTPSFFETGSMPPFAGRYFLPTETEASRVTVLSQPLWEARFHSDLGIIGQDITLNGEKHTVVGITPAAYSLTAQDERLWTPLSFTPEQRANYGSHTYQVFALLKAGVTIGQAQRELERITEDIRRRNPENMKERGVQVQSFNDVLVGDYRTQLWVLFAAVSFVLLIGCGNVASLLLARAAARRKEIAIRSALGGGRRRLLAQLLTESLVLAMLGGAAGLLVAYFGIRFLVGLGPAFIPRLAEAGLHLDVLVFALGVTLGCGLLFGLVPAFRATRLDLQGELRDGRGSRAMVRDRVRASLIITEIAVALILLVSAGLFLRSAERLGHIPLGFTPEGVTMMRVALPADRYTDGPAVEHAFTRMVEQVRAIPGVETAAASTRVPMWGGSIDIGVRVDGRAPDPKKVDVGHVRLVTPGFVEALGIPVRAGRSLQKADMRLGAPQVVVVNETFARSLFGEASPLGQRISGWTRGPEPEWREIVGVIGDVRSFGRENNTPPEIYFPMSQAPADSWTSFQRSVTIVARGKADAALVPALRAAVASVDALVPLYDVQTMNEVVVAATSARRFNTMLLSLLGATALILAAIGIYGVIAFFVTQRTPEIGLRVALGATTSNVIQLVVRQAALLAVVGIVLGGLAAAWVTRVLGTLLFQVSVRDPIAYAAAALILLLVALAAAWLPARRAARVDPVRALGAAG